MNYIIKYDNLTIHAISNIKMGRVSTFPPKYDYTVTIMEKEGDYEKMIKKSPYANCIKINLEEQLTSKNLKKTLPKRIMLEILELPEVILVSRSIDRDDKLKTILDK